MIYADSSALVKRYVKEAGSVRLAEILSFSDVVATSKLAFPELLSVFARKRRSRELSEKSFRATVRRFEEDWKDFLVVDFHDDLLPLIKTLVVKYALKGADSVHLSSALWLSESSRMSVVFSASDEQLLKAARAERLEVFHPDE
jgi:predicted nucleic acid-binding protein